VLVGDVEGQGDRIVAATGGHLFQGRNRPGGHRDARPFGGHGQGHRPADALAAAGDESRPVGQAAAHGLARSMIRKISILEPYYRKTISTLGQNWKQFRISVEKRPEG
jgi:hypothetical protein